MAATVYPSRNDSGFPQALMTELDFRDNRYPSLSKSTQRSVLLSNGTASWDSQQPRPDSATRPATSDRQSIQSQEPARSVSYSLPAGATPRVVERYSLDDNTPEPPSRASAETRQTAVDPEPAPQEPIAALPPSAPRHPSLPAAGIGTSQPPNNAAPSIIPLSASPGYVPPISGRHRAYPQQPTYINQTTNLNPVNPILSRAPPPQEEVCIECAMRDQDMADVDVTSPGVWDRESDVAFEELKRRDAEEEASGVVSDDPSRPKLKGGKLTEQNLKIWLSLNPREPASRQQTLHTYLKSQRALLEAEALAHARAMQEARQLDSKMRDTYSRLRTSAYDTGSSAAPTDDVGGVRIKAPHSPTSPGFNSSHSKSHSRDITLLENGMIVEHVDVRKEEREARERRRREERRARKSSRSSGIDVTSLMSTQSLALQNESGTGLRPYSHYAQPSSPRPMSVLTAPLDSRSDRPAIPRAQSQASFSDIQSLGTPSPRRSRFFGIGNFKDRWRSQDSLAPSGISGSMIDMHLALHGQHDPYNMPISQSPVDTHTARRSQIWPTTDLEPTESRQSRISDDKAKKKKTGLAKIWQMVKRSSKTDNSGREDQHSNDKTDDDLPLAPPPPLSYLVNRESGRHASTPSLSNLQKAGSPGMSPSTAPSSLLPSPSSSRPSNADIDVEVRKSSGNYEDPDLPNDESTVGKSKGISFHSMTSEPDIRQRLSQSLPPTNGAGPSLVSREKSLPPLPGEAAAVPRHPNPLTPETRPRTVYTFDTRQLPPGFAPAHDFLPPQAAFRTPDSRRQSFGGLSSRPNLDGLLSMSVKGKTQNRPFSPNYDEFGNSHSSLHLASFKGSVPPRNATSPTPTKRKSRFNLSSLLGKRPSTPQKPVANDIGTHQWPTMRHSGTTDVPEEVMSNGYNTSTSRHSGYSGGPRLSITSRKALEELVTQDAEFVAYRYPSTEQRLDLLR